MCNVSLNTFLPDTSFANERSAIIAGKCNQSGTSSNCAVFVRVPRFILFPIRVAHRRPILPSKSTSTFQTSFFGDLEAATSLLSVPKPNPVVPVCKQAIFSMTGAHRANLLQVYERIFQSSLFCMMTVNVVIMEKRGMTCVFS